MASPAGVHRTMIGDMTALEQLLADVDAAFVVTGDGLEPWPDPNPERSPDAAAYSRVTAPERYRLIVARARAWVEGLVAGGIASATAVDRIEWAQEPDGFPPVSSRVRRDAARPGTVPLFVIETGFAGLTDNAVEIAFGDPSIRWEYIIDCGCDACDSGSADLLAVLDEAIIDVVSGALRYRWSGHRSLRLGVDGASMRGEILSRRRERAATAAGAEAWRAEILAATEAWAEIGGASWLD